MGTPVRRSGKMLGMSEADGRTHAEEVIRLAEAEAAEAQARAQAAAARAAELRRQIDAGADADEPGPVAVTGTEPAGTGVRRAVLSAIAGIVVAALLTATGLMLLANHTAAARQHRASEYAAAARQSVVNLMAIDYTTAEDSVRRVLDGSTGKFRDNFAETSEDFVKALQEEKIITAATVNDAAVESMTDDSAVVLVSATSRREGPKSPADQQQPRVWRVVLTLQRDGGQIKMSGVEFV